VTGSATAAVAGLAALGGFVVGALRPALHCAVEPAQVLAGRVAYPDGNPFHLYQVSVWTIWHQILAPWLAAGVPERTLSLVLSGVMGALAFAAIALFARVAGAAPWLAVAVPFLLVRADTQDWGLNYPIALVGQAHTYGMAGLSWLLLVVALLGAERWRAAAFLLGRSARGSRSSPRRPHSPARAHSGPTPAPCSRAARPARR
jgi:hypothetical protein